MTSWVLFYAVGIAVAVVATCVGIAVVIFTVLNRSGNSKRALKNWRISRMRIPKSKWKNGIRYMVRNYFRAGFFSMTVGVAAVLYGVGILIVYGLSHWLGYFEIAIGALVIFFGFTLYQSHRSFEKLLKQLEESRKILEMHEKGINYF